MDRSARATIGWSTLLVAAGGGLAHGSREPLPAIVVVSLMLVVVAAIGLAAPIRARRPDVSGDEAYSVDDWWRLNAERHQLALLLEQVPTPLLTVDSAQHFVVKNRAARAVFATDHEIASPPPELVQAVASTVPPRTITLPALLGSRTFLIQITTLVQQGERVRLIALTDIQSDVNETEANLLQALLKVLEHEIRNGIAPLASLAETTRALLDAGDAASIATARDAVATICRRSESVLTFADEFRAMSNLPAPVVAECRLSEVAMDLKLLFDTRWAADGVSLTLDVATDIVITADHNQIVQALWAIVENAAEATVPNAMDDRHVRLTFAAEGDGARIQIDDSGRGFGRISAEQAFLPFVSGKALGSGIGLSLARQICRGHGGDIVISPTDSGKGTSVVVRL